jgi:hypothetical protein
VGLETGKVNEANMREALLLISGLSTNQLFEKPFLISSALFSRIIRVI